MSGVIELSKEEHDEYEEQMARLSEYQERRELFNLVEMNYRSWVAGLDHAWDTFSKDHRHYQHPDNLYELRLEVNRLMLNWLSSIRTYLDHTVHALSGSGLPGATEKFELATKRLYDGHFAYRFIWKLRNYAQHHGTPISSIEMSAKLSPNDEIHYYQLIGFNRYRLLEYQKWSKVGDELDDMPENFNAEELVDEMMECIRDLADMVDRLYASNIQVAASFMRSFIRPVQGCPGNPCILTGFREHLDASLADSDNPDPNFTSSVSVQWVPLDWISAAEKRTRELGEDLSGDSLAHGAAAEAPLKRHGTATRQHTQRSVDRELVSNDLQEELIMAEYQIPQDLPRLRADNGCILDERDRIVARLLDPETGNPIKWPPDIEESRRTANMMAMGPTLVWALMALIVDLGKDDLRPENLAGAMFAVAMALSPGQVRFNLDKMDPEFLDKLRHETRKRGLM